MSQEYVERDDSRQPSESRAGDLHSFHPSRPNFMTVGPGSASATAQALVSALDHDSGYGGSTADGYTNDGTKSWNPAVTEDRYTPADTPGNHDTEGHNKYMANHIHQLFYNQNKGLLARYITHAIESLRNLQQMNTKWPAQYPPVPENELQRQGDRPRLSQTRSSASSTNLHAQRDNQPLRPSAPKRAGTSLGETASAASSSREEPAQTEEEDRLITPQSAQEFSVLKMDLNMGNLTQAEIAHSLEKKTVAALLDRRINQTIRHLDLLRDRIEDTSSKVLVTGDLNAGKSTFCNALLRRKVLPEDQQPCTSIFCEVFDAKENSNLEEAHAIQHGVSYDRNNETTYDVYQLHELEKIVGDHEKYMLCKIYIKDSRPIDESLLNNGVVDISLIDAPGLNADSLKTTALYARQEEIDVVVFVVSAANHFTLSAREFIWRAAQEKAYMFMVVNGFDNIRDKDKCERVILEQVQGLSPQTFKESSELVHFVSSNAIPTAPPPGPPDGGDGSSGGSGSSSGPSNDFPKPDDDDDSLVKHGEPGSPPKGKGKGKDKEKIEEFENLEQSLRRFVLEKRARSKLAPARTYLLNTLADITYLATVNQDIATAELKRVTSELSTIEPAYEASTTARTEVSSDLESTIEQTSTEVYTSTRTIIQNALTQSATSDPSIPYPGLLSCFQYAEDLKLSILQNIHTAVTLSEQRARSTTLTSVNTIKNLGILHLGNNKYPDRIFNPDRMFAHRRAISAKEIDFEIEYADFLDFSALWEGHKLESTSMALTLAGGAVTTRLLGGYGWLDGILGTIKILGPQNTRKMILPAVLLSGMSPSSASLPSPSTFLLSSLPFFPFHAPSNISLTPSPPSNPSYSVHTHPPPTHPP